MGIRRMQGTSAYLEYIGPKGKKKKKNCIYYKDNQCRNIKSPIYLLNCIGRMLCHNYDDLKTEEKSNSDEYENNLIDKSCKLIYYYYEANILRDKEENIIW